MTQIIKALSLTVALVAAMGCGPGNGARMVSGSGSTFIKPIMDKWIDVYTKERGGEINYQGSGSTAGINYVIQQAVDFGCTDAFLTPEQREVALKRGGDLIHVPLVMGAIVPAYNLPGIERPILFSGEVLADIFLGKIKKWNDPALQNLNEGIALPERDIAVVYRTEGSGSTYIFTKYLHAVSPTWRDSGIGYGVSVDWRTGTGEQGNPAVAGFLGKTEGSIGYVELYYALLKKEQIQYGAVRNRAGKFVVANLESVAAAAENALQDPQRVGEDLNIDLLDAPGDGSYPISGMTWAVFFADQDAATGKALVDFFTWVVHDGQKYNESAHFARLPEALIRRIEEKLRSINR